MTRFLSLPVLLLLAIGLAAGPVYAQPASSSASRAEATTEDAMTDREEVRQAALDYVESLYEVDSMRVVRSVHPELIKYGYHKRDGDYHGSPMNYQELKDLAASWNKDQKRVDPETATKEAVVFDVLDKTASAKVVAHWGVDYLHLVKEDGTWMIRQILWQSPPE
jgi:hypothetical protein